MVVPRLLKATPRAPGVRTRRAILDLLKQEGPQDSTALAARLSVSTMAVRQHLYDLERGRLVTYEQEARPLGRPAKVWRLTPAANRFFPDGHADLTLSLVDAMKQAFGSRGLERLLAARARQQAAAYRKRVPGRATLRRRLEALARVRTEEGYMAEVRSLPDGALALVENHCPICSAARACAGLCGAELDVFREVLGRGVRVERTEHILSGARRCAYRVTVSASRRPASRA